MQDNVDKIYVLGSTFSTMEKVNWMRVSREFKQKVVWIDTPEQFDAIFHAPNASLPISIYRITPKAALYLALEFEDQPTTVYEQRSVTVSSELLPQRAQHLGSLWSEEVDPTQIQQWEYIPFTFITQIADIVSLNGFFLLFDSLHIFSSLSCQNSLRIPQPTTTSV